MVDAAEKLAACQETIYLLGRQLQALRTQTENYQTRYGDKLLRESSVEGRLNHSGSKAQDTYCCDDSDHIEADSVASADVQSVVRRIPCVIVIPHQVSRILSLIFH
ncbi:filament-like plant protein 5 [Durio zibethinus]|uniref:Filament-like plant protein 5 n=1 Tax=Durio zibethinus TaxID=66656 RepID=A0A6P5YNK8_DURZI|nr:filament-like plant protein 5 [Durio zibethinus]